jgi:peroxiredoxin
MARNACVMLALVAMGALALPSLWAQQQSQPQKEEPIQATNAVIKAAMNDTSMACCAVADAAGLVCSDCNPEVKAEVGKPAINFELTDVKGEKHTLASLRGKDNDKLVVLTWSNADCPIYARIAADGTFTMLTEKYKDKPVVFVQIDSTFNHKPEDTIKGHEKYKHTDLRLTDYSGKVGHMYVAKTTPHSYVIDTKGKLVYAGAIDDDQAVAKKLAERTNYVAASLDALLKGEEIKVKTSTPYGCTIKYAPAKIDSQM